MIHYRSRTRDTRRSGSSYLALGFPVVGNPKDAGIEEDHVVFIADRLLCQSFERNSQGRGREGLRPQLLHIGDFLAIVEKQMDEFVDSPTIRLFNLGPKIVTICTIKKER